jgi:RNA polymerase sigma factor (sigma-70 family)
MNEDSELLRRYAEHCDEAAFETLVQRHVNLVFAAALRQMGGDAQAAEDVAQIVFADLARKAEMLARRGGITGWLYTSTRFAAAKMRRAGQRRRTREHEATQMNATPGNEDTHSHWQELAPVLDEAMHDLKAQDREALLLRYFQDSDFKSMGTALGLSEGAAQMRVSRTLERLRRALARRGIAISATALSATLGSDAVISAPAGLAASAASTALASAATDSGSALSLIKLMTMTKLKAGVIAAIAVAGVATPLAVQRQTQVKLRQENQSLRQQVHQLAQSETENVRLSNLLAQANGSQLSKEQLSELMKLRGEVGLLRRQTNELGKLREENRRLQASLAKAAGSAAQSENDSEADRQRQEALAKQQFISKMGYARNWVLAFHEYAGAHQGQFPGNFGQAETFLPDQAKDETLLATNQFEIMYQGSLNAITNPAAIIVLRESESQPVLTGGQVRTYGFADGHSEVHKTDDGNFEPWERQHMILPVPPGQ